MDNYVKVEFNNRKTSYFPIDKFKLKKNLSVIVSTERGLQFGYVRAFLGNVDEKEIGNNKIIRISTKKDYQHHLDNLNEAKEAVQKCKELSERYELNIQVLDADFTFDREQLLFRFISDTRIDFRDLAKDLARFYKTRIELRQIGIRDKAREISGVGPCGRRLCCSLFLKDINSVSINMAKNQNIALNPNKINGCCGRLLCCLNYEDETYSCYRKNMPNIGDKVKCKGLEGTVTGLDILNKTYTVLLSNNEIVKETVK